MPKPYPSEFRDDVVRVARGREPGVTIEQIATDFGVHPMTLTKWLRRAAVEEGAKPGVTRSEGAELREARKRIRLLQEVEVLRRAAAYLSQAKFQAAPAVTWTHPGVLDASRDLERRATRSRGLRSFPPCSCRPSIGRCNYTDPRFQGRCPRRSTEHEDGSPTALSRRRDIQLGWRCRSIRRSFRRACCLILAPWSSAGSA